MKITTTICGQTLGDPFINIYSIIKKMFLEKLVDAHASSLVCLHCPYTQPLPVAAIFIFTN